MVSHAQVVLALIVSGSAAMGLQTAATRSSHGKSASRTYCDRDAARASVAFLSGLTSLVYLSAADIVGALAAHDANVLAIIPLAALG